MAKLSCALLIVLLWGAMPLPALAGPPVLRYTSYLIVAARDMPVRVHLESRSYGSRNQDYTYSDQPTYAVIGADSNMIDQADGRLGSETQLVVPGSDQGFALVEVRPGNNYCVARPEGPHGYIATATAPLNVVGELRDLWFFVPKGLTAAAVILHAWSVGEAGRAEIRAPDGTLVAELEDDFNDPVSVSFVVPPGQDDRAWSFTLAAPRNPDWRIDDCKVWLCESLPGILTPEREWAEPLSRPFVTEWRSWIDFETGTPFQSAQWNVPPAEGADLPSFDVAVSGERPHTGKQGLRVEMRLPERMNIRRQELKLFMRHAEIGGPTVERVKFWLYGDGSQRPITVRLRDQHMEHHYYDCGTIDWQGWGEVVADFARGPTRVAGGDQNRRIDGPKISLVIHIGHELGHPLHSVYIIDDVALSP